MERQRRRNQQSVSQSVSQKDGCIAFFFCSPLVLSIDFKVTIINTSNNP